MISNNLNFYEMEWCLNKSSCWNFQSLRTRLTPNTIKNREWLLAISLKNPLFSNKWIKNAVHTALSHEGNICITLVDEPYMSSAFNLSPNIDAYLKNVNKLYLQKSEQLKRIMKLITQKNSNIRYKPWNEFFDSTPRSLIAELTEAFFKKNTRVRELVEIQVSNAHPEIKDPELKEKLADFFLNEAPALVYFYYMSPRGVIDIYPGSQARFFWELDAGLLNKELPITSLLASTGKPHVYCYNI